MRMRATEVICKIIVTSIAIGIVWLINPNIFGTYSLQCVLIVTLAIFLVPVIVYELISISQAWR